MDRYLTRRMQTSISSARVIYKFQVQCFRFWNNRTMHLFAIMVIDPYSITLGNGAEMKHFAQQNIKIVQIWCKI